MIFFFYKTNGNEEAEFRFCDLKDEDLVNRMLIRFFSRVIVNYNQCYSYTDEVSTMDTGV